MTGCTYPNCDCDGPEGHCGTDPWTDLLNAHDPTGWPTPLPASPAVRYPIPHFWRDYWTGTIGLTWPEDETYIHDIPASGSSTHNTIHGPVTITWHTGGQPCPPSS